MLRRARLSGERFQERPGLLEIVGVKALGASAVERGQQGVELREQDHRLLLVCPRRHKGATRGMPPAWKPRWSVAFPGEYTSTSVEMH